MKKIRRNDLKGLNGVFPVLSEKQKKEIRGGGANEDTLIAYMMSLLGSQGFSFYDHEGNFHWTRYGQNWYDTSTSTYGSTSQILYTIMGETPIIGSSFCAALAHITGRSLVTIYQEYQAYKKANTISDPYSPVTSYLNLSGFLCSKGYGSEISVYSIKNNLDMAENPILAKLKTNNTTSSTINDIQYSYSADHYVIIESYQIINGNLYFTYYDPITHSRNSASSSLFEGSVYVITADSTTSY